MEICYAHKKTLKFWCQQCKQPVCRMCMIAGGHIKHQAQPFGDVRLSAERELQMSIEEMLRKKGDAVENVTALKQAMDAMEKV